MEKARLLGRMEECMKVNINLIKSTATVYSHGQMVEATEDNGKMENNTAKDIIRVVRELKDVENGSMEEENIGWMKTQRSIRKLFHKLLSEFCLMKYFLF